MAYPDVYEEPETIAYRERAYGERERQRKRVHWVGGKPKRRRKRKQERIEPVAPSSFKRGRKL